MMESRILAPRNRLGQHIEEEVDSEGSWAVSYGDMITLLLTFFILFFSTDTEKDRLKAMEASLLAVFNKPDAAAESLSHEHKLNVGTEKGTEIDAMTQEEWGAKIYKTGQKLIVEFPATSFFDFSAIDVNSEGAKSLYNFAIKYLPYSGNYILGIRAFTDNRPVAFDKSKRYRDNLELSALRSVAAMRVLQKSGIPLARMKLGGWGELKDTAHDLTIVKEKIDGQDPTIEKGTPFSRKVILVIEPEMKAEGGI